MPIDEIIQPVEAIVAPDPDDVLELGEAPVAEQDADQAEPLDTPDDEFPDTFDDEAGTIENKGLLKLLRERDTAQKNRIRELEQLRNAPVIQRTERPTLESCDYDEDKFEAEFVAWQRNEQAIRDQETARTADQQQTAQSWQQELSSYKENATKLGKPDFGDAEELVISALSDAQQTTVVMAAKDPARFIYALGRSPNRLAALATITNPIKLAAEVARIEGVRMMPTKTPPNIDTPARGSGRLSTPEKSKAEDKQIAQAAKTGDIDALRAWRKSQKAA